MAMARRDFLKIGGMVMGGLTLPQLLAAEAQAGIGKSHKAIINVFLPGGPPHQDMWDIKVDAPAEIRGEFQPIKTNVQRHRDRRDLSRRSPRCRQVRLHPLDGRRDRRARRLSVHDGPAAQSGAGRRLAGRGGLDQQAARGR